MNILVLFTARTRFYDSVRQLSSADDITPLKSLEYNLQIIFATPHHSLTVYKVSALLNQNCNRSYPETNMLKNLSKGL